MDKRGRLILTAVALALIVLIGGAILASRTSQRSGIGDAAPATCFANAAGTGGRIFHVDARRGSDAGDGSALRPWRSLTKVVEAGFVGEKTRSARFVDRHIGNSLRRWIDLPMRDNPDSVIRGGDTILLASGDYGSLRLDGLANEAPVRIAAAPGATARFTDIAVRDIANFTFSNLIIAPPIYRGTRTLLTTRPDPEARRSYNLRFTDLRIDGAGSIADTDPASWAKTSSDGVMLFGDCIELRNSTISDTHIAVMLYQTGRAVVDGNTIRGFSVDGIDFSGHDIVISNNVIRDHWPTGDLLHPDCMQGQAGPNSPENGPVRIVKNVCLSDTGARNSESLQGINIFDGRWNGVTIACNFVRPTLAHGISLYGVDNAEVGRNIVVGWPGPAFPWIAAVPAKDGRHPRNAVIKGNIATTYLNAIHGGPGRPQDLVEAMHVNKDDKNIRAMLAKPVSGVTLIDNEWRKPGPDLSKDKRFRSIGAASIDGIVSVDQARREIARLCPA